MKHKTAELTGLDLDYAVCMAAGLLRMTNGSKEFQVGSLSPSTDWRIGGPIIERERISLEGRDRSGRPVDEWVAKLVLPLNFGQTPLIAAMRAYVAAKLGDEVELPE